MGRMIPLSSTLSTSPSASGSPFRIPHVVDLSTGTGTHIKTDRFLRQRVSQQVHSTPRSRQRSGPNSLSLFSALNPSSNRRIRRRGERVFSGEAASPGPAIRKIGRVRMTP